MGISSLAEQFLTSLGIDLTVSFKHTVLLAVTSGPWPLGDVASEATLSEVKYRLLSTCTSTSFTSYSLSSEVAFVYFKAKLLGGLGNLTAKFTYF